MRYFCPNCIFPVLWVPGYLQKKTASSLEHYEWSYGCSKLERPRKSIGLGETQFFTLTDTPSRPIYGHQSEFFQLYHKRDVGEHKKTQWNSYYLGLYLMIKSHKIEFFHRSGFPLMNLCQKMAILNELVDVAKRRRNELKFFLVVVLYICMVDLNVQGGGRIKSTPITDDC